MPAKLVSLKYARVSKNNAITIQELLFRRTSTRQHKNSALISQIDQHEKDEKGVSQPITFILRVLDATLVIADCVSGVLDQRQAIAEGFQAYSIHEKHEY